MNKKKTGLALVLIVALLLTAIGGTLAYFTDTKEATNVFAVGNIKIELHETGEVNGQTLENDEYRAWLATYEAMPGISVDKNVWVKNIGSQPAYIRVVITVPNDVEPDWAYSADQWTVSKTAFADVTVYTLQMNEALAGNTDSEKIMDAFALKSTLTSANDSYELPINVYAIQAAGFNSADAAFDAYRQQEGVTTQDELNKAIADAKGPTIIELADGSYTLPAMSAKNLIIKGSKNAVIDASKAVNVSNSTLVFDGLTLNYDNDTYEGFQHSKKLVFKDCAFTGTQFLYAPEVDFINCTFSKYNDTTEYSVWTYGAENVTFTDCVFTTGGKAILVYNELTNDSFVANVTLDNCLLTSDGSVDNEKAAIETGVADLNNNVALNTPTSNRYNITVNNCTVIGFGVSPKGTVTYSNVWSNKNSMDADHLKVTINNVSSGLVFDEGKQEIDLSNKEIAVNGSAIQQNYAVVKVNYDSSATISGNGTVKVTADTGISTAIAVWARNGGDIVIEDGTYILERTEGNNNELELIYASDTQADGNTTTITIKGGTFKCDNAWKTLNIHGNGEANDAEAFIYVMGGTYWNFNPATDSEDAHVIIPEGYKVISEVKADGTWYTVVPDAAP